MRVMDWLHQRILVWLQGAFDTLTGLFNKVGIRTNNRKTVGMLCCPCRMVETQSEAAYDWRMTKEVITYRDRQRLLVKFPDCGMDLTAGFLVVHWQTQPGVGMGVGAGDQYETPPPSRLSTNISDLFTDFDKTAVFPRWGV